MDAVHTRNAEERKLIPLNEFNQPIRDDKVLSEFSNFLGTLGRQYIKFTHVNWSKVSDKELLWQFVKQKYIIHDDAKSWVMQAIGAAWRGYKCQLKKTHYKVYNNDEDRLANKPDEIPTDEFKVLLKFWGDKKVQERATKLAENRKAVKDVHTARPKSFAQIRNKLQIQNPNNVPPSKAELYVATRKRTSGRSYKATNEHTKAKIARFEEIQSSEGENSGMSGDSSHGNPWLLGRGPKSMKKKAPAIKYPDELVNELRTRLREEVKHEMEDEMNKKMTLMMKQLARLNPGFNVNIDTIPEENASHEDADAQEEEASEEEEADEDEKDEVDDED